MKFSNVLVALVGASVSVNAFVQQSSSRFSSRFQPTQPHWMATVPEEDIDATAAAAVSAVKIVPDVKAYASAYKTVFNELPCKKCTPSQGSVPPDLVGTYYRCGPAMFSAGSIVPPKTSIVQPKQPPVPDGKDPDRMVSHPLEGDGAILGVTFSESGDVTARFRYVRTPGFTNERKKGARLYKSMDSTRAMGPTIAGGLGNDLPLPLFRHHLQPGLNKNRKNTSNTRAVYWGKRLLSMWEGGQPFKMDELALSTEGRSQLGGAIRRDTDPFGSRLAIDSKSNRAVGYGAELGQLKTEIALYEFDDKFRLLEGGRTYTDIAGLALVNDFCITENYAVFVQPKLALNAMQFMVAKDPGKTLTADSGPAMLHLIPRPGAKQTKLSIPITDDGSFEGNFQFVNAYEEGDEVIIDAIRVDGSSLKDAKALRWPWGESLSQYQNHVAKKSLWRYTANLRDGSVKKRQLDDSHGFFGTVNPSRSAQKHRYIYYNVGCLGNEVSPLQGIAKFDCETSEKQVWFPSDAEFCGEPMFARKAGKETGDEDDGYLISVLYNGNSGESEVIILDAQNIASGPVARLPLGIAIPHGLFGCFTDSKEARWEYDEIERRAKLADKMESKGNRWNEVKSDFSGLGLRFDDMEEYFGDFFS